MKSSKNLASDLNILNLCSGIMIIREAIESDKTDIATLYQYSQRATGLPSPLLIPPWELGRRLYERDAIKRYVAIEDTEVVGHGIIEEPNPEHGEDWHNAVGRDDARFMELGAAFVDPAKIGRGIWSSLLIHRLHIVRSMGAIPVSVTWSRNHHVKKRFEEIGGTEITQKETIAGAISLFIMPEFEN